MAGELSPQDEEHGREGQRLAVALIVAYLQGDTKADGVLLADYPFDALSCAVQCAAIFAATAMRGDTAGFGSSPERLLQALRELLIELESK